MPDEDQLFLRPYKPPPAGISEGEYQRAEDMEFIKGQIAQLRRELPLLYIVLGGAALIILWAGVSQV